MSVVSEIVTGKRTVISYVWSPVAKAASEAGGRMRRVRELSAQTSALAVLFAVYFTVSGCASSLPEFRYADIKIEYVFRSDADFEKAEVEADGKVFALPSLRHGEVYDLYPLSCTGGVPPFVVVDVFHTNEETDRRLFQRIKEHNAALLKAGKIDQKYNCVIE